MKIINKIRIRYYRSLKEITLDKVNNLNIFSGQNDSGKSNILKVLDVFFNDKPINFDEDYNKERLSEVREKIKGKQFIDIRITINTPKGYTTLPPTFTITKAWDRNGDLIGVPVDNLDSQIQRRKFKTDNLNITKRSLSTLLKKIRYKYIPGVRDERFFLNLLQELQIALFEKEDRRKTTEDSVKNAFESFNQYITKITGKLNSEFRRVSGIETNLSFPSELTLLFERLLVDTKTANYDVPLYLRGDGIRLWYIPSILHHIAKISPKYFIWGFDEPENSCEYSLANKLANDFLTTYSENSQIFVSTHSFSFISLEDKNCSRYRVFKDENDNTSVIEFSKLITQKHKLLDELGIVEINSRLKEVYDEVKNELLDIETIKSELVQKKRPFLIFEGESDSIHFTKAFSVLYGKDIISRWALCDHLKNSFGSSIGDGASHLNHFLSNHIGKIDTDNLIIGIFDCDEEGITQIKGLKENYEDVSTEYSGKLVYRHKKKINVYAITLVPPEFRMNFVDFNQPYYSYLSTELLHKDSLIDYDKRKFPSKNDTSVYSFKGRKMKFAKKVEIIPNTTLDCGGFLETFNLLDEIIKNY